MPHACFLNLNSYLDARPALKLVEVSGNLTVATLPPAHPGGFFFWAVQVSFFDAAGKQQGWGHLGLQWHGAPAGLTAACWGGGVGTNYRPFLPGSISTLPPADVTAPADDQENARILDWQTGREYRLTVRRVAGTNGRTYEWVGEVSDVLSGQTWEIRRLYVDAEYMRGVSYWAEDQLNAKLPLQATWTKLAWRNDAWQPVTPDLIQATYIVPVINDTQLNAARDGFTMTANVPRVTPNWSKFKLVGGVWQPVP